MKKRSRSKTYECRGVRAQKYSRVKAFSAYFFWRRSDSPTKRLVTGFVSYKIKNTGETVMLYSPVIISCRLKC